MGYYCIVLRICYEFESDFEGFEDSNQTPINILAILIERSRLNFLQLQELMLLFRVGRLGLLRTDRVLNPDGENPPGLINLSNPTRFNPTRRPPS